MRTVTILIITLFLLEQTCGISLKNLLWPRNADRPTSENNIRDEEANNIDCEVHRTRPRIATAIVGGAFVQDKESTTYVAAIGEKLSNGSIDWFCGATLISRQLLLTAAHCVNIRKVTVARIAETNVERSASWKDLEIDFHTIHPDYNARFAYNDIAIIKLADPVCSSSGARPICLYDEESGNLAGQDAYVMGWGAEDFRGERISQLKQVRVEIFDNAECNQRYANNSITPRRLPRGIVTEQLCAGSSNGGRDSCQGDSGGPLVVTDRRGDFRLAGIVSAGSGCGIKQYPGIYTRIAEYSDWIKRKIEDS